MAWRRPGDKPLSEPMMLRLPTHICVTQPQWVNCWYQTNSMESTFNCWYQTNSMESTFNCWYQTNSMELTFNCWYQTNSMESTFNSWMKWKYHDILTHWGRDKMDTISQTTFSNAFSWMKMHEFHLRFHWSLFLRIELTIFQHWFR